MRVWVCVTICAWMRVSLLCVCVCVCVCVDACHVDVCVDTYLACVFVGSFHVNTRR